MTNKYIIIENTNNGKTLINSALYKSFKTVADIWVIVAGATFILSFTPIAEKTAFVPLLALERTYISKATTIVVNYHIDHNIDYNEHPILNTLLKTISGFVIGYEVSALIGNEHNVANGLNIAIYAFSAPFNIKVETKISAEILDYVFKQPEDNMVMIDTDRLISIVSRAVLSEDFAKACDYIVELSGFTADSFDAFWYSFTYIAMDS